MLTPQKLDSMFEAACDAIVEGLQNPSEEAIKARPNLVKGAVELLKFSGHELAFENNDKARQISNMVTHDEGYGGGEIIEANFTLPFDGSDNPVKKGSG